MRMYMPIYLYIKSDKIKNYIYTIRIIQIFRCASDFNGCIQDEYLMKLGHLFKAEI